MLEEKSDNLQQDAEGPKETQQESTPQSQEALENIASNNDTTEVQPESSSTSENNEASAVEDHVEEIDINNAEDAEDEDNNMRHEIPLLDYHSMNMEALVVELEKLVKNEKVQAIKKHVDGIKYEFDLKFNEFIEQKKEDFVAEGGNAIDFSYTSTTKNHFKKIFNEYRERKNQYYKDLEQSLKTNLQQRKDIIEELKSLLNVEENINTTYKHFKELQETWKNAGPIPRNDYNNIWRTYHHHVERFYDFLHLNRDLRDLDFKHNLEEKLKIIEKAEALDQEEDLSKAFRELQTLHKVWKEDLGPVSKEHRNEIWDRFSNATKVLHQKRQEYYNQLDQKYEENLVVKNDLIAQINAITQSPANSHANWQKQIKEIESLRTAFFNAGKVPQKVNEATWSAFKESVRGFNRVKNAFYKELKKEQHKNLEKKLALIEIAESLKDSTDWDATTPQMKKIQADWKKIGHVPRKNSDKIWAQFKKACNFYFDALHAHRNAANKDEVEALEKKKAYLDELKTYTLSGDREEDLKAIKAKIGDWKNLGKVPFNKRNIDSKFHKIIDALFKKLDINREQVELMKYSDRINDIASTENNAHQINKERAFIRRKMDEIKGQINQLENNLQFFSNASDDSPVVRDVIKNINKHKQSLDLWKAKLKSLNIIQNKAEQAESETDNTAQDTEA